ncbi:DNA topoisomerase IB [Neorhizobium sp. NCHU2750]|uniref:DNA topoisomerase IB n=1 Tax=Neorhizobium sp. NCHU2750 TaxID=1825976 RepID=UPI0013C47903
MDVASLEAIGLTYVSDTEPGIRRLRRGKGFSYKLPDGLVLSDDRDRMRIAALGLPPAYENVWICLDPRGHLQATGYDARGRKQYRYHADWQSFRSEQKFDQLARFGAALPKIRRKVKHDLSLGLDQSDCVLAALVALMDATYLRVGNRAYAKENRTYGATTLLKRHMVLSGDGVLLKFTAKGGKRVQHTLKHPRLQRILEEIADLPGRQLFSFPDEHGTPRPVDSGRLNAYLAKAAGFPISAKTFRTWGGSLAAFVTAWTIVEQEGKRPKIKALTKAASEVLQNTPAVCRSSYVHPAILDLSENVAPLEAMMNDATLVKPPRGLRLNEARLVEFLKMDASPLASFSP